MKNPLSILSKCICRTPFFALNSTLENDWVVLKELIRESSSEFFSIIKDVSAEEICNLSSELRFSIWKYANRAKYRATPNGRFGAITTIPIQSCLSNSDVVLQKKMRIHRFSSWKRNLSEAIRSADEENANFFQSNTSFYSVGDEIRFLYKNQDTFELTSIDNHRLVAGILVYCSLKRSRKELYKYLYSRLSLSVKDSLELIRRLIGLQLLLTDKDPNIIGNDYFKRINFQHSEQDSDYLISERLLLNGTIKPEQFEKLREAAFFLSKILETNENDFLRRFKSNFLRRYEHRLEVSLLEALDPEIGVGYTGRVNVSEKKLLVDEVSETVNISESARQIPYSDLHKFLLNAIPKGKSIQLEQFNVKVVKRNPLPNTFSALVQIAERNTIIKQIGGCSFTALTGRFTLMGDEIESFATEAAQIEEKANPDVIFCDISYHAEEDVDDINRRRKLYSFELPILTWGEGNEIIGLNDLMVSVNGEEVVLRSKKYNKRVIPRVASAYNYSRSDLDVFRFLSDLQHQGLQTNLNINLEIFFPGLDHYPRIMYKEIVLSPEKWILPPRMYRGTGTKTSEKLNRLTTWLSENRIVTPFLCGFGDQKLYFDPSKEEDLFFLLLFARKKTGLYIEEAFLPDKSLVNDEFRNPYQAEFLLGFSHRGNIYKPIFTKSMNGIETESENETRYMLGSEWMYLKFYCHSSRSNELLLTSIKGVLINNKVRIRKWFFIRYNDPDYHIRLRIHLKSPADLYLVLKCFEVEFRNRLDDGTVRDLQLTNYSREIDRYGIVQIPEIEAIFSLDSSMVLSLLRQNLAIDTMYSVSVNFLIETMSLVGMSLSEQLTFTTKMAASFSGEQKVSGSGFKSINRYSKEFWKRQSGLLLNKSLNHMLIRLSIKLAKEVRKSSNENGEKLLSDVFHMHVNRLYYEKQRVHELIIYEFVRKFIAEKINFEPPY